MSNVDTKICKICGKEKPINEFNNKGSRNNKIFYDSKCKVCEWFSKRIINYNESIWCKLDDEIIIDSLLNHKLNINEISDILNKSLHDVCNRIKNILKLSGQIKLPLLLVCPNCKKEFETTPFDMLNGKQCCSKICSNNYKKGKNFHKIIGIGNCKICAKEFNIFDNVPNQKYCSDLCKSRDKDTYWTYTSCSNCNKEIYKPKTSVKRYQNNYCCLNCELEYKHKQKWEFRTCEICNKEFECLKSSTQKMCSIECQGKWQSIKLVGENAHGYNHDYSIEDRTKVCEWCGKKFQVKPYQIETAKYCSSKCRQQYYSQVLSQTEEWKERSRINTVNMIENGCFNNLLTKPQIIINNLLDQLNITYQNEKGFKYFNVDNYLLDYNLVIEVMGTFWHCDNRIYNNYITYGNQVNRIRMDKIKHTYILNQYNIEVLYLWEEDIINNIELCKSLILQYIKNNGKLINYHSLNYSLNDNNLALNNDIKIPYMEWDIHNLNKIIDLSVKEKMSHKQLDKWITYNCEYCGKEKEQLISHYNKTDHHYCSRECSSKSSRNRVKVNCNNCNNEIEVTQYKFEQNKRFFCNQKCQHEYQKLFGFDWYYKDL